MDPGVLAAIIAALVGALGTYLAVVRRLSGKITTSAAEELWNESRSIREDLQTRNQFLTEKIDRCEARIEKLEADNRKLYLENGRLKDMIEQHEETIKVLREEVHDLREENRALRAENVALKGEATKLKKRVKELEDSNGTG